MLVASVLFPRPVSEGGCPVGRARFARVPDSVGHGREQIVVTEARSTSEGAERHARPDVSLYEEIRHSWFLTLWQGCLLIGESSSTECPMTARYVLREEKRR